eukprot:TRINITY_DN1168_c0_g5_i1.p1 TRINITY_DN1168_c0_g5~~TRINITY_DN1168_c0_g5_i1.p1  ORF type:complete len:112 (+),score=19.10 TRINITY_DN1168_c0_g5_i1:418-753(+)
MKMSAMAVKTVSRKAVTPMNRWVKAEVFPLIAMMSAGLGFMTYTCVRSLTTAPDVFVVKQKRQEGGASITEAQGRVYKHGPVREFVRHFYNFESTSSPFAKPVSNNVANGH